MTSVKISELVAVGSLVDTDVVPVSQGAVTKKATISQIAQTLATTNRWTTVPPSAYTSTPASTSRITMSDTTAMQVSRPIRWTQAGIVYYGIVRSVVANTYIDVSGPSIPTAQSITSLQFSTPEVMAVIDVFLPGTFASATRTTAIADLTRSSLHWHLTPARLVSVRCTTRVASPGSTTRINVSIGGNWALALNGFIGMTVGENTSLTESGGEGIFHPNAQANPGSRIEITVTNVSSILQDATVSLLFVVI